MDIEKIKRERRIIVEGELAKINLGNLYLMNDYLDFMQLRKELPRYDFEYIDDQPWLITDKTNLDFKSTIVSDFEMSGHLFDYQKHFTKLAIEKTKYAIFLDTGKGKTSIEIEFAIQLSKSGIKSMIVCPLLVLTQFKREIKRFYDGLEIYNLRNGSLEEFKKSDQMIGIVNFEYFREERDLNGIGCFILDESSILKSEHGVYGKNIIASCNKYQVHYRLAASATPAPNDYAELANHALFLGKIKTYSQFFADWFQKDFKDSTRWLLRAHAKDKFYKYLSSWSILMRNPEKFGFSDNTELPPEYYLNIEKLEMMPDQIKIANMNGEWLDEKKLKKKDFNKSVIDIDIFKKGITIRNKLAQISKGFLYYTGEKNKRETIRLESWKPKYVFKKCYIDHLYDQFLVWTELDEEELILEEKFNGSRDYAIINGATKEDDREQIVEDFIDGKIRILITKPKILGFGLNLQHVEYMIYYGISDSYERFYQSVRRAYRYGQTKNLKVFIPITDLEKPIVDNVNLKSESWEKLITEQENYFAEANLKN